MTRIEYMINGRFAGIDMVNRVLTPSEIEKYTRRARRETDRWIGRASAAAEGANGLPQPLSGFDSRRPTNIKRYVWKQK